MVIICHLFCCLSIAVGEVNKSIHLYVYHAYEDLHSTRTSAHYRCTDALSMLLLLKLIYLDAKTWLVPLQSRRQTISARGDVLILNTSIKTEFLPSACSKMFIKQF